MAILTASELTNQAKLSYGYGTYYLLLLNNITANYTGTTVYADILADEVVDGRGGYSRLSFTYSPADITAGVNGANIPPRVATFVHDGGPDGIVFTHVALVRLSGGTYTLMAIESLGESVTLTTGNTARIELNFLHSN